MLRSIGRMDFPITHGRGDEAIHPGSPDRGEEGWRPGPRDLYSPPFATAAGPNDLIRVRSQDFHERCQPYAKPAAPGA